MSLQVLAAAIHRNRFLRLAATPALLLRRAWLKRQPKHDNDAVHRLAELLVDDPVIKVDSFQGKFAVGVRSHLFHCLVTGRAFEPVQTQFCLDLLDRNRDAIDVGANVGFYTILIAKNLDGRQVLAIEPTTGALTRLRRNIKMNAVESAVVIFAGAATDYAGQKQIKIVAGLEEYSTLGALSHPSISGQSFATEGVAARTIDDLVADNNLDCGFMKVDVEGWEHAVFAGAERTLAEHRPVVMSELSDFLLRKNGSSAREVVLFFEALNYAVFDPLHPNEKPGFRDFGDIICRPRERLEVR